MRPDDVFGNVLACPLIKDAGVMHYDYTPEELVGREGEYVALSQVFRPFLAATGPATALLVGQPGAGKSALAKRFTTDLKAFLAGQGRHVFVKRISCVGVTSMSEALALLNQAVDPGALKRGTMSLQDRLQNLLAYAQTRGKDMLIVLDDPDVLLRQQLDVFLAAVTRLQDATNIGFILTCQEDILESLSGSAKSTLGRTNVVHIRPLGREALEAVLEARVGEAFAKNAFTPPGFKAVVDAVAPTGDVRYLLEVAMRAVENACSRSAKRAGVKDVQKALLVAQRMESGLAYDGLPESAKRILHVMVDTFTEVGGPVGLTKVEAEFNARESSAGRPGLAHTQVWNIMKLLERKRLLTVRLSGASPRGGRKSLITPKPDIVKYVGGRA